MRNHLNLEDFSLNKQVSYQCSESYLRNAAVLPGEWQVHLGTNGTSVMYSGVTCGSNVHRVARFLSGGLRQKQLPIVNSHQQVMYGATELLCGK
jgi:hypothetical protein